jgi:hypothetical protein
MKNLQCKLPAELLKSAALSAFQANRYSLPIHCEITSTTVSISSSKHTRGGAIRMTSPAPAVMTMTPASRAALTTSPAG